jgi:hypothetical protein
MDNDRPSLDLKYFEDICPDKNGTSCATLWTLNRGLTWEIVQVPVIAVFTKYDQFRREVRMKLEDQRRDSDPLSRTDLDAEMENIFNENYLANLGGSPPFLRLESENFINALPCTTLIVAPKECTSVANGVLSLLKGLPTHSLAGSLASCSWLYKRIILNWT